MNTYPIGSAVTVAFSLAPEVVSVRRRVLDEAENVLDDWTDVPMPAAGEDQLSVLIPEALNLFLAPATAAVRVVELRMSSPTSVSYAKEAYLLQVRQLLVPGINSFQTYYQAVLASRMYAGGSLPGWESTEDEDERTRALIEAFGRIRQLPVFIEWESNQSIIRDVFFDPPRLIDLDSVQILALDKRLFKALVAAQLVEADAILNPDTVGAARRAGVQSMTVGESSQFFGAAKPFDHGGCSPATTKILARWLRFRVRVSR